jgi:hypothetical protein
MSKINGFREAKVDPKKKDLIKKFSILPGEVEMFKTFQSILTIHNVEMDAVKGALVRHAINVRKRLDVKEEDAPKGYERFVDFDPETYDLLVIDRPIIAEPKVPANVEKAPIEAKNGENAKN